MPRYDDEYYDGYDEEEEVLAPPQEENIILHHTPWWAISAAFHAMLLLAIWSITLSAVEEKPKKIMMAAIENYELPEPPKILPPNVLPEDRDDKPIDNPTEDPRICKDAEDDHNEDPTNQPFHELRPNPNPNRSNVEGPYPQKGFNSSIGLGGNIGGGGGPGGRGGFQYRRARGGGGHKGDQNVMWALYWLRDHQQEDGVWSADGFHAMCGRPSRHGKHVFQRQGRCSNKNGGDDRGWKMATDGVTGLATLAFLGAGYTQEEGEFKVTVKKALRYLLAIQTDDGCFGPKDDEHYVYNHAISTMAVAEAYAMTGAKKLKGPAQRAVDFIASAQNEDPDRGYLGWRYGVKPGESDGSVTGWMVLALKSARAAQLSIPDHCWEGAKRLYDDLTGDVNGYPKTGYITKGGPNARLREAASFLPNPSIDAINVLCRLFMGVPRTNSLLQRQASIITQPNNLPTIEDKTKIDLYYWYYASLAIFQMGGSYWKKWEDPMIKALTGSQRTEDMKQCVYGSWDPIGAWGMPGGRVYATAINCLTLKVYYRYEFLGANKSGR